MSAISDMYRKKEVKIPFPLTQEEIQMRQAEYFSKKKEVERFDEILADAKKNHKYDTDPLKKEMGDLWMAIDSGKETRTVWALEIMDDETGEAHYCDPENPDSVWSTREMTPAERTQYKVDMSRRRQRKLFEAEE